MTDQPADAQSLKEKFAQELDTTTWKDLREHVVRDTIILIDPSLDIVDVGVLVALDQSAEITKLIEEQQIGKPTLEQIKAWEKPDSTQKFKMIIAEPYILTQLSDS